MKRIISLLLCTLMTVSAFSLVSAADEWTDSGIEYVDGKATFQRNPGRGIANTLDTVYDINATDKGTTYVPKAADFKEKGLYTPFYVLGAFSSGNDFESGAVGTGQNALDHPGIVGGVNKDINQQTLDSIRTMCELARAEGVKLIPRFAYENDGYVGAEPDDFKWVLRHVEQISEVLSDYPDAVIAVDIGMIGPWGEMHSTPYSARTYTNPLIDAWLTGLHKDINILSRSMSYILYYRSMMPPKFMKSLPITEDEGAYRIGMFNDGYLGNENDYGTFSPADGSEGTALYRKNAVLFLKDQAKRIPYGGELAYVDKAELRAENSPVFTDEVLKEFYDTHLYYLRNLTHNSPELNDVLKVMRLEDRHDFEGMPDISAYKGENMQKFLADHMGYRFVLRSAEVSSTVKAGDCVKLRGSIENVGFGNIIGKFYPELILTDKEGKVVAVTDAYIDPAKWESCKVSDYNITLSVPADLSGDYNVYLRISSIKYESYKKGTCYVSFANPDVVNADLGANYLGAFTVSGKGGNATTFEQLNTGAFKDVKGGAWYEDAVYYAAYHGIMGGVGVGKFDPDGTTTRAMLVQVLYNMEGKPDVSSVQTPFTDISGKWYEAAVKWAYDNEVVNGMSATTFAPEGKITREQFATIIYRYSAFKGYNTEARADLSAYTDEGKISSWAKDALSWANKLGYIGGMTATTLVPTGNATRAQMAQIMMRFMKNN